MALPPDREERRHRVQVNKLNLSNVMLSAGRAQALMEHEEQHHEEVPLQLDSSGPSDGIFRDTITSLGALGSHHGGHSSWGAATGHIITAVVGAGVLTLPHAVSWLGWLAGPLCLTVFFVINIWCAFMLADVYEVNGRRHNRYKHAVYYILGPKQSGLLSLAQHLHLVLLTIGYHIAAADSMRFLVQQGCEAANWGNCPSQQWLWTLAFGVLQVLLSFMPDLESAWLCSMLGAAMSLGYSFIALGLGAAQAHNGFGELAGRSAPPVDKLFGVLTSLGNVAFAYNSCVVMIEIQDTLREPPRAAVSMRKAITASMSTCFCLYMAVGCLGYAALGDAVPASILQGFPAAPAWARSLGNLMVLVHMAPAYQVFAQPMYATIEDWLIACMPSLAVVGALPTQQQQQQQQQQRKALGSSSSSAPRWRRCCSVTGALPAGATLVRVAYRTLYVCCTTLVAAALPFFGAFGGLIGAVTFYPTAVYFPSAMYCKVYRPSKRSATWLAIVAVNVVIAVVTLLATAGSISNIVKQAASMQPFGGSGDDVVPMHGR